MGNMASLRKLLLLALVTKLAAGIALPDTYEDAAYEDAAYDSICPTDDDGDDDISFITLEEHWLAPSFQELYLENIATELQGVRSRIPRLVEVGPERIAAMDEGNVAIQVVSHVATSQKAMRLTEDVRAANDALHARVVDPANDGRFRGFCALPMAFLAEAAAELRRCVAELGFVGALVDAHFVGDRGAPNGATTRTGSENSTEAPDGGDGYYFYDSPAYDVLWAALVELNVPIYLHPCYPPQDEMLKTGGLYASSLPGTNESSVLSDSDAVRLGTSTWGWHSNAGLSFLKLFGAGVFDRHPQLQVVLGHMGELVPYYLGRVASRLQRAGETSTGRNVTDVYANNVYVTFGGYFSLAAMYTLLEVTNATRVMHSVDYPFGNNTQGKEFMESLRESGLVTENEYRDIAFRNAKRLLKI
ncbi:hypothetical protein MCOR02_001057 [Pyricularia oryzae]|nr:hypothetical protein MCOR02_001057 [Pyricularia oryzae]KAI6501377.1 hypothetical protein MCOR13_005637 [Pyricularia oryzae]